LIGLKRILTFRVPMINSINNSGIEKKANDFIWIKEL